MAKNTKLEPVVDMSAKAVKSASPENRHSTPVTIGALSEAKTSGIKMRGTGAATKGTMSRGPMA